MQFYLLQSLGFEVYPTLRLVHLRLKGIRCLKWRILIYNVQTGKGKDCLHKKYFCRYFYHILSKPCLEHSLKCINLILRYYTVNFCFTISNKEHAYNKGGEEYGKTINYAWPILGWFWIVVFFFMFKGFNKM